MYTVIVGAGLAPARNSRANESRGKLAPTMPNAADYHGRGGSCTRPEYGNVTTHVDAHRGGRGGPPLQ